ncbi:XdhC family protein [Ideonella sp. B7]|uniref:XdhC family protein n=1 Tax=Ideonella benzenivorans TaxID=2831643 RepID=UPI001CEC5CCA|nr:XdhC family protein [Ideonella benzenivorans]MCA6215713.1 XdhC family protein [Ideonella benzenivorans]
MEPLDAQVLRQSLQWQAQGRAVLLVTVARTWGSSPRPPGSLMALCEDGRTVGSVSGGCVEDDLVHRLRQGDTPLHAHPARPGLVLIGAGDLSRYLASMARGMGFDVIVCDPRPEQAQWREPGIGFSREMPDDLVQRLQPDRRTAVVAVTHDPKLDDLALIDALQTEAQLARLHGPAGLCIGSKTPAEIALSILAEVVAVKNGVAQAKQGLAPPPSTQQSVCVL